MSDIDEKAYQDALRNTPDPCSTRVFVKHYEAAKNTRQPDQHVIEKIEALRVAVDEPIPMGFILEARNITIDDCIAILKEAGE